MLFFLETMRQALEKKDLDLEAAKKTAEEKMALADQKLASVKKLEEENTKLRAALDEANKEVTRLKKDKGTLTDKVEDITHKRDELENYLGGLAKKLFLMLEGTFPCPIDLLSLTHHITVDSLFLCECRILSKLRGRDWTSRDKLGPHQLPC
jgi:septal ring factor EnvC (AmiA/AmiB activator)